MSSRPLQRQGSNCLASRFHNGHVSKNRDSPFNPETRITSKHRKTATDNICEEKLNSWCLFWKRVFVFLFWVGVGWRVRHVRDYEPFKCAAWSALSFLQLSSTALKLQTSRLLAAPQSELREDQTGGMDFGHNPSCEGQTKWEPNIKHVSDVLTSGSSCRHFAPLELCVCDFSQQDK